jgi:imidazolonepropionase-like amidohydrolase
MKRIIPLLPLPLLLALIAPAKQQQTHPKLLAFTNATVIDATGAPPRPGTTVVITGDRITAVGSTGKVKVPAGAQVINAAGKFLIPGLWDMHVHTVSREFLSLYVANGVTGVRDMGNYWEAIKPLRDQVLNGSVAGPRIIASGPIVDGPKPVWPFSIPVGDESQGRQAVTTLKQRGVDFIKVYSLLPRDAYFAIAGEAKKQRIAFAGHVPSSVTLAEASDAGQKSVEHLDQVLLACSRKEAEFKKELAEARANAPATVSSIIRAQAKQVLATYSNEKAGALFTRLARNGTWQAPTLTVLRAISFLDDPEITKDARVKYMPPFVKQMWNSRRSANSTPEDAAINKARFQKIMEILGAMRRRGVEFLAGTDTPNPYCFPGFSVHDELQLMVKAGFTPMEAIQAATRNPAKFLGMLDSLGAIEQGKVADMVLLDANPLQDISSTQRINAVVVNGRLLDKKAIDAMLEAVERTANR